LEGELPSFGWSWSDGKVDRYSQGTNLISGIDIEKEGAVQGRVQVDQKAIIATMDMSDSMMLSDDAYRHFFRDASSDPLYDENHSKIVAMREAIKELKGDSDSNKVLFVHKQSTGGLLVEKELVPQMVVRKFKDKVGKDVTVTELRSARAFHVGTKTNPQTMVHVEAKAPSSGFWNKNKNNLNDFTFDEKRPDGGTFGGGKDANMAGTNASFWKSWMGHGS
jgi:hypothetical protein